MLSRCMIGKWRALADECTSGYAVLDKVMDGTKDAARCFDVASENATTEIVYDTGKFSLCLNHWSADDMSDCVQTR